MRKAVVTVGTLGASAVVYLAIATLGSTPAYAAIPWQQDVTLPGMRNTPGCATHIAVGPNNTPWVIGCGGPNGNEGLVYELVCSETGNNGQFGETCSRVETFALQNGSTPAAAGVSITVDTANVPWMTSADGHISILDSSLWVDLSSPFANDPPAFMAGRASQVVAS